MSHGRGSGKGIFHHLTSLWVRQQKADVQAAGGPRSPPLTRTPQRRLTQQQQVVNVSSTASGTEADLLLSQVPPEVLVQLQQHYGSLMCSEGSEGRCVCVGGTVAGTCWL